MDSIAIAPAPIAAEENAPLAGPSSPARLPLATIAIPVPNGDALDTPDAAPVLPGVGPDGVGEEGEGSFDSMGRPIPIEDLFVKDAFLVFRALCKLSMKALVTER